MSEDRFIMDNKCVLVSALRYLNVMYDIDLVTDDHHAPLKLRSYVKLLNEDEVLTEYWEMYKATYHQEKAASAPTQAMADDYSLWDNDMNHVSEEMANTSKQELGNMVDDFRIVLPRGI